MKKIYVTRKIPEVGIKMLKDKGYEVDVNPKDKVLDKKEMIKALKKKQYDAVLCLLTDTINKDIYNAVPSAKIFANYAVGFNNIDVEEAKKRGITITNTPGALTDTVAEHTIALLMSLVCRVVEGDSYMRKNKYKGWGPLLLLGTDLKGLTLGLLGAGRIGSAVSQILVKGFGMKVVYYDVKRNEQFEQEFGATFYGTPEDVLKVADVVSIHVPMLPTTKHLIDANRLKMMKKTAYIINSSRGPVIDEKALVNALKKGIIAGAGLDVYEFEPKTVPGLTKLPNVVLTPHTASATLKTRGEMAVLAAQNIIDFLDGKEPKNKVVV